MPFSKSAFLNHKIIEHDSLATSLHIHNIITNAGISIYNIVPLASDASRRIYYRINAKDKSYILMNAALEPDSVEPFIKITNFLTQNELCSPEIIAADADNNLLLITDFGDNSFNKVLLNHQQREHELYEKAIYVLVQLYKLTDLITLENHYPDIFNEGLQTFIDWYLVDLLDKNILPIARQELFNIFTEFYKNIDDKKIVILRDYHVDNLMLLANNKVGLLDFQCAALGHPAYDLVSLLEDARRSVSKHLTKNMLSLYFRLLPEINQEQFIFAYSVLGLQRNLRIIGTFHRLHKRDNNSKYIKHLPLVWSYIKPVLQNSQFTKLKEWAIKYHVLPK